LTSKDSAPRKLYVSQSVIDDRLTEYLMGLWSSAVDPPITPPPKTAQKKHTK